jgi:hypothetical protein
MYGLVTVNLNGPPATDAARWQSDSKFSDPSPSAPVTTPAGLRRKPIGEWRENSSVIDRPTTDEMPAIGRMKYSIIPFVSG